MEGDTMERRRAHEGRMWVATVSVMGLFAGLFGRLCWIQGKEADTYRALAREQHYAHVPLMVRRGTIYDAVGRELAVSTEVPSIYANARLIRDKKSVARRLARLLGIDGGALLERLERRHERVCLKDNLTIEELEALDPLTLRRRFGEGLTVTDGGLYAAPEQMVNPAWVAEELAPLLSRDAAAVEAELRGYFQFIWVRRKVTEAECQRVLRAPGLTGVGVVPEYKRKYVHGELAGQLLGFVGIDENGLEGLELAFNDVLAGTPGYATFRRDAAGRYISDVGLPRREPEPGGDLELTVDTVVQSFAEGALAEAWEKWAPKAAMAVVIDPRTGDVLAAPSLPAFNPNRWPRYSGDERQERMRARYVVSWLEPGSIMKPFVLSAALTEGVVDEGTVIDCENGVWIIGSRRFHDHHAYGDLTAAEVIIKSSNVGAAKIGTRLGPQRLHRYLRAFGFGQPTGFPLRGENPGLLRPPSQWTTYSLPSICIGQEICVNMVQTALAFATIANDGVRMRPRLVRRIRDHDGQWRERPPQAVTRVIPAPVARRVRRVLLRTVEEGTGRRAKLELYSVGGKTGTAQKAIGGRMRHREVICSF
ncbi:MAG: peptidoglycan D,D-transpeptidase FtsI family protein, partial [Planctomycetota bacterium]